MARIYDNIDSVARFVVQLDKLLEQCRFPHTFCPLYGDEFGIPMDSFNHRPHHVERSVGNQPVVFCE